MTANPPSRLAHLRALCRDMLDTHDEPDLRRQSHAELSPLLWHVGHVFFVENYWLAEQVFGDTQVTDPWRTLYFPELCAKGERSARLPDPAAMHEWTREIETINDWYWARAADHDHPLLRDGYLAAFVRQHYAQHLETMRMASAQCALAATPHAFSPIAARPLDSTRIHIPRQTRMVGTADISAYDNEQPRREHTIEAFEIDSAPVSNGQWLYFMQDGGYETPGYWDEAGWHWRRQQDIDRPQHWQRTDDHNWQVRDLNGAIGSRSDDPVHGIGWYEARAFARWAGARLPDETEWEIAVRSERLSATGQVWEWCADAFAPYPGFQPFPYDEYSMPWFDGEHFVARGASHHTEADIRRPGFRNFYPPTHRHVFAGLRLAW